jgi:hypothetical protein
MQPFLAMIIPAGSGGGEPSHPIAPGGPPPGIWPDPGRPTHPIAPGGRPPGIWGGAPPYVDIGLPGQPPGIWGGRPPWVDNTLPGGGGSPPGIWGGAPPWVDNTLPGWQPRPSHPIAPGGGGRPPGIWGGGNVPMPTPPIFLPPGSIPGAKPEHPIYIPPGSGVPGVPTHPIVLPPPGSEDKPEVLENWEVKTAWSEQTGWLVAIVPSEQHPGTPTPSSRPQTPGAAR